MKKYLWIVIVVSLLAGFTFLHGQKTFQADSVLQIHWSKIGEKKPAHSHFPHEKKSIKALVSLFNNALESPENKDISNWDALKKSKEKLAPLSVEVIRKNEDPYHFLTAFDWENYQIWFSFPDKQGLYSLSREETKTFLDIEGMDCFYSQIQPNVVFSVGEKKFNPQVISKSWWIRPPMEPFQSIPEISNSSFLNTELNFKQGELISFENPLPGGTVSLLAYQENKLIEKISLTSNRFMPLSTEQPVDYYLDFQWKKDDLKKEYGSIRYGFKGIMDLPPQGKISRKTISAGDMVVLEVNYVNDDESVHVNQSISKAFQLIKVGNRHFGFLSTDYHLKPDDYNIDLVIKKSEEIIYKETFSLKALPTSFKKQHLTIDKKIQNSTRNDKAYKEYAQNFASVRDTSANQKLWEGLFVQPVKGRISTEFGEMRYVNGALTSYRHSGVDIAAPKGTPIVAPNKGKVVFSGPLILTGKTLAIDHGYGLFTVFFHLDRLDVNLGDTLDKGQLVGTVGTTGFSTGPHLHWTMSHYKTNLNPWRFTKENVFPEDDL